MRLKITEDCCATARRLIADGLDPSEMLEFCRGDMVSLRGTARAFARRKLWINHQGTPVHVRYKVPERAVTARPIRKTA
jgi:hypothetical protein